MDFTHSGFNLIVVSFLTPTPHPLPHHSLSLAADASGFQPFHPTKVFDVLARHLDGRNSSELIRLILTTTHFQMSPRHNFLHSLLVRNYGSCPLSAVTAALDNGGAELINTEFQSSQTTPLWEACRTNKLEVAKVRILSFRLGRRVEDIWGKNTVQHNSTPPPPFSPSRFLKHTFSSTHTHVHTTQLRRRLLSCCTAVAQSTEAVTVAWVLPQESLPFLLATKTYFFLGAASDAAEFV